MKIGIVVNEIATEIAAYTSIRIAKAAWHRGHEVWLLSVADFIAGPKAVLQAHARTVRPKQDYESLDAFLSELQGKQAVNQKINIADLDVLLLRNDPSDEVNERSWAQTPGVMFGQLAAAQGVLVLNDPSRLAQAINKTYFQHFPEAVRPKTLITRDKDDIRAFIEEEEERVVIKPLQGSGGQNVFLLRPEDRANFNQIIDAVLRDGYAIVQEYLPAAEDGDIRFFVMNGEPLQHDGHYAAFRRVNHGDDMRSNMHAGGKGAAVEVDDTMLRLVELVRPKLVQDGMFLVGLDIVGDKLMEINVFSPGGLGTVQQLTGVDFATIVVEELERKVDQRHTYDGEISNTQLATLDMSADNPAPTPR